MGDHDRELGAIDARLAALEKAVTDLDKKMDEVREAMLLGRGWSRVGAYAGAVLLVFLGALAGQLLSWLWPVR